MPDDGYELMCVRDLGGPGDSVCQEWDRTPEGLEGARTAYEAAVKQGGWDFVELSEFDGSGERQLEVWGRE